MKFAQLVIGPAGCGKSTYCETMKTHCDTTGRPVHVVNLDPAAEQFNYPVSIDVRDLITLDDVAEELGLGPNGGLLYCMEFLEENLDDWLGEELEGFGEDDYLIIDCPGQIELYSHVSVFKTLTNYLKINGWNVCAVYCMDSQFVAETPKFVAGCLAALSAMVQLELPHVNMLTKVDLVADREALEPHLIPDALELRHALHAATGARFSALNDAIVGLLDEFAMVSFTPLDIRDEESVSEALLVVDTAIQYGEDQEVRQREYGDFPEEEGGEQAAEEEAHAFARLQGAE